jgi:hypothetical protein
LHFITGFTEHIEYETGSGRQALAPNASLTICEDVACEPTKVVSSVKLEVEQPEAESICEIDAESIESRNERCGNYEQFEFHYSWNLISPVMNG